MKTVHKNIIIIFVYKSEVRLATLHFNFSHQPCNVFEANFHKNYSITLFILNLTMLSAIVHIWFLYEWILLMSRIRNCCVALVEWVQHARLSASDTCSKNSFPMNSLTYVTKTTYTNLSHQHKNSLQCMSHHMGFPFYKCHFVVWQSYSLIK